MNIMLKFGYIVVLTFMFFSCAVPKKTADQEPAPLPSKYLSGADSSKTISAATEFFPSVLLRDLIDSVLAHNYDLRIAEQRIALTRAQWLQSRAPLIPQVNFNLVPSLRKFGLYTMDGAGNIVTDIEPGKLVPVDLPDYYGGLQSSWEIDLWGKLKATRNAAAFRIKASEEERRLIKTTLVAQTAGWYYELLAADEELRMLKKAINLQEQAVSLIRLQKETGKVNELAVQQFDAQLLGMRALSVQVEQGIVTLETLIAQLLGKVYQPVLRDSIFFDGTLIPKIQAGIPSELLLNRPDIRMAEWDLMAAKADVQAARKSFLPSLNITATLGIQGYRMGVLSMMPESIAYSLISGLSAPVINRRALNSNFQKTSALQQQAFLQYEKSIVNSFNEVRQHLTHFGQLHTRYELKEKEASVLTASIEVAGDLFKTGRANYLDVLLATQRSLMSNVERIQTKKEQLVTLTNMYRSLGGGW